MTLLSAALLLGLAPLAGCTNGGGLPGPGSDDGAHQAAQALAAAISKKDVRQLPWSQASGQQAQTELNSAIAPLGTSKLASTVGTVQVTGSKAAVTLRHSWTFPGVTKPWTYDSPVQLIKDGDVWKDVWQPDLVQPDLTGGARLIMKRTQGERGDVLAGDDSKLMTTRAVRRIGIDKSRVSADAALRSARQLADLVDVDAKRYAAAVKAAGPKAFVSAIVFRADDDDLPSDDRLAKIKGAISQDDEAMLSPKRGFAAALLGQVGEASKEVIDKSKGTIAAGDQVGLTGLQMRYESLLGGKPSVKISVQPGASSGASPGASASPSVSPSTSASSSASPAPAKVVFEVTGSAGKDLKLSLDSDLQSSAEKILSTISSDSALVAVKPSTGQILAAANGPDVDAQNNATFGQYPPGSTFKLASSLALLRAGEKPSTEVSCPKTLTVNGQQFKNYSDYPSSSLGTIDLKTAVAQSCNTAFIGQRDKLSASALASAASSLGIGTDYDVGFPAYYGSVPKASSENEKAASMIGQAKVQASPMAMAGAIASVQEGKTVLPWLVNGQRPTSKAKPLSKDEAAQLRSMLAAVVKEGSGGRLKSLEPPSVIAKTGTAEYGNDKPPKTHAWMVAAQGDLAVAVFVAKGKTGSTTAGPLLQSFLAEV